MFNFQDSTLSNEKAPDKPVLHFIGDDDFFIGPFYGVYSYFLEAGRVMVFDGNKFPQE